MGCTIVLNYIFMYFCACCFLQEVSLHLWRCMTMSHGQRLIWPLGKATGCRLSTTRKNQQSSASLSPMPQFHKNLNEQICRHACEQMCMWMNTVRAGNCGANHTTESDSLHLLTKTEQNGTLLMHSVPLGQMSSSSSSPTSLSCFIESLSWQDPHSHSWQHLKMCFPVLWCIWVEETECRS